jgi:hypothetical protein
MVLATEQAVDLAKEALSTNSAQTMCIDRGRAYFFSTLA